MERCAYELDTNLLLTAVRHLLYCCITHGGWVDRFVGVTAVLRNAVLLYYRVVGWWIGSFLWCVAVVCPRGFVGYFVLSFSRYRPRAGIVQRTTSSRVFLVYAGRAFFQCVRSNVGNLGFVDRD